MTNFKLKLETSDQKITIPSHLGKFLVEGSLPDTVRELIFDDDFNAEIEPGVIPMGTEIVEFGKKFNAKIKSGVFPITVTCIKFGRCFNHSLENVLPENLKIIIIRNSMYHHKIDDVLPPTVTDFHFAFYTQMSTEYNIPLNTTELYITSNNESKYKFDVPVSVKKIYLSPKSLKYAPSIFSSLKNRNIEMIISSTEETEENVLISYPLQDKYIFTRIIDSETMEKSVLKMGAFGDCGKLFFYNMEIKTEFVDLCVENIQLQMENVQLKTEIAELKLANQNNNNMKEKFHDLMTLITQLNPV